MPAYLLRRPLLKHSSHIGQTSHWVAVIVQLHHASHQAVQTSLSLCMVTKACLPTDLFFWRTVPMKSRKEKEEKKKKKQKSSLRPPHIINVKFSLISEVRENFTLMMWGGSSDHFCFFFFFSTLHGYCWRERLSRVNDHKIYFFFRIEVVYPFIKEMRVTYQVILGSLAVS